MRFTKAVPNNPDQYVFNMLSQTGEQRAATAPVPFCYLPDPALANANMQLVGMRDPHVLQDPKLSSSLWTRSLPSELVIFRKSETHLATPYVFSNENPDRLLAKDPKNISWEFSDNDAVRSMQCSQGFIGFGGNAVLDWASNASHLVHADIDEEVLKTVHYIVRPLILVSKTGREFLKFLTGMDFAKTQERYDSPLETVEQFLTVVDQVERSNSIPANNFRMWSQQHDERSAIRDEVLNRAALENFDPQTMDALYRYTTVIYGLESVIQMALPIKTSAILAVSGNPHASLLVDTIVSLVLGRYLVDTNALTIANDPDHFETCKERYRKGNVRYAVGNAQDPELYEAARGYFESNNCVCDGVFTSNIQFNHDIHKSTLLNAIMRAQTNNRPITHWGAVDDYSSLLEVEIIQASSVIAKGSRQFA